MSVSELLPTIQSLRRSEKEQLYHFLAEELSRKDDTRTGPSLFVPPPQDHCPYTPDELAQIFQDETGGVPLSEIWRKLGRM